MKYFITLLSSILLFFSFAGVGYACDYPEGFDPGIPRYIAFNGYGFELNSGEVSVIAGLLDQTDCGPIYEKLITLPILTFAFIVIILLAVLVVVIIKLSKRPRKNKPPIVLE